MYPVGLSLSQVFHPVPTPDVLFYHLNYHNFEVIGIAAGRGVEVFSDGIVEVLGSDSVFMLCKTVF